MCKRRADAWIAMANTVIGGVANVAHIVDEATARRDIDSYGKQSLTFL